VIWGVTGKLGGGKSWFSVRTMAARIAKGGIVVTNIELDAHAIADHYGLPVEYVEDRIKLVDPDDEVSSDPWTWPIGDRRGRGSRRVLVVIDEAGEWFAAAESRKSQGAWRSWLRQSDKRGQDVFLIVQHESILARQGRVLCHRWFSLMDMSKWKIPKLGIGLPWPWNEQFKVIEYDYNGRDILDRYWLPRDRVVFGFYDTSALFGSSALMDRGKSAYDDVSTELNKDRGFAGWIIAGVWICAVMFIRFF